MKFKSWKSTKRNKIKNAFEIIPSLIKDQRGFFSRMADIKELSINLGYEYKVIQVNNSLSNKVNTFRGFHMQLNHAAETKIVRCIKGSCVDFILDLRISSATFMEFGKLELSDKKRNCACIPKGCAHGILTCTENTELIYLVDNFYNSNYEFGINAHDKLFGGYFNNINLYRSDKDISWPEFDENQFKKLL